jgi:hypothetical protein
MELVTNTETMESRGSTVDTATDYRLDVGGVGVSVSVTSRMFTF